MKWPFRAVALSAVGLLALASPALPQTDGPTITQAIVAQPLAGHVLDFEEGVRDHLSWAMDNGSDWTWRAWEFIAGERTGSYLFATGNHGWADFDSPPVDPMANRGSVQERIAPHVDEVYVSWSRVLTDLSMTNPDEPVRPMVELITMQVDPQHQNTFEAVMADFKASLEAAAPESRFTVYQRAVGGNGSEYVLAVPRANWAAFDGVGATDGLRPPMEAMYGRAGTDRLQAMFGEAVLSTRSEVMVFRPDLSQIPPG